MAEFFGDFETVPLGRFLGITDEEASYDTAGVIIVSVPYEPTVSWSSGTAGGPRAIVEASRFIELWDHQLDREPHRIGIHTLPELHLTKAGPEQALADLRRAYDRVLASGKFPILLGGEHAVSGPPIEAVAERVESRLSVLQLDAHTDLRAAYHGTPFSHASVMYRIRDRVDLVPVGIRSVSPEERELIRREGVPVVWAHELETDPEWIDRVLAGLGPDVYITIDVDYFDPSLVPSTGTPEPGGGTWYPTLALLERVFTERTVHAADVVELAPIPGFHAPDFLVAKLVYKLVGFHQLALDRKDT